jgi:preprotein translocase subunit SecG
MKNIKQTTIFLATAFALVLIVTLGASMLPNSKKSNTNAADTNTNNTSPYQTHILMKEKNPSNSYRPNKHQYNPRSTE